MHPEEPPFERGSSGISRAPRKAGPGKTPRLPGGSFVAGHGWSSSG